MTEDGTPLRSPALWARPSGRKLSALLSGRDGTWPSRGGRVTPRAPVSGRARGASSSLTGKADRARLAACKES